MLHPDAREKVWLPVRNENCKLCPLHETAQSVCLLGDGPVPNRIMLVGEAPGAREDDIAKPFAGAAGQYLDRILSEVGLGRANVYITNSVRCRPPDNATPSKGQIKACGTYMDSEIQLVRPTHMLLLGNTALQAILGTSGVMKKRGTAQEVQLVKDGPPTTVFVTVHPAAVLRNPALEGIFRSDLLSFARLSRGEERRPETKSALIQSSKGLSKLCRMIEAVDGPIAFDVETGSSDPTEDEGGLHPWSPQGVIHTVAFSWEPGRSYVVSLEHPATKWDIPVGRVYEALGIALSGKKMVGHNLKFDMSWLKAKGIKLHGHFDTVLAAHLLDENGPKGLKALSRTYLGADEYEAGISFGGEATDLARLAIYNGKDADYTLRLYHIFKEQLKKQPRLLRLFVKLMMPACRAFTELEANGFPVDVKRLEARHKEAKATIARLTEEMMEYVPDDLKATANFNSPQFLGNLFFTRFGLPILERTPKGAPSTNESVLLRLRALHPAVDKLMERRKWTKYESTYTRNWIVRVNRARKPRLYTSYNLSGTVTGRLSSNMQQVPRDLFIRGIIGSRPGWRLIEADFAQIELRIATMLSNDRALTQAFLLNEDPHAQTAAAVMGKPQAEVTKEERKMAKAVNFGFLYGMGWKKFRTYAKEKYGVEVNDEQAQAYRRAFFEQYSGLQPWHERQRRAVRNMGYVRSPIGRVRHLPTINSTDDMVVGEAEREAINSPVQGLASDFTVLSMIQLQATLDPKEAKIIGNVHDSIMLEAREDVAEEVAQKVKYVMEHLPLKKYFGWEPTVPIVADVTVGTHWGEH